jgi:poly(A) polymerase
MTGKLTILPDAPWRHMAGIGLIHHALGSVDGLTRFVGGAVRDCLAGQSVHDVDLATRLTPDEVTARLQAAGVKVVPTGIAHGTVTAVVSGGSIEVTTLRRDVSTDGRRATVAYTNDWQEDAARRDFTINALYADPFSGEVFDYFGGIDDLAEGKVRFIGDPAQRIAEDHLRILRFFRFHARFAKGAPDPASMAACAARANDLMALSRERIADELFKILGLPNPVETISLMLAQGNLKPVLPEIESTGLLAHLVAREADAKIVGNEVRRLASLIPADSAVAEDIGARLKLSKTQRKRLISAAKRVDSDGTNPKALAYWMGVEAALDRLLIGNGDPTIITRWAPPRFPITGGAIVKRGIKAGPDVAAILKKIEHQWVDEGFPDADRVMAIADELCA